MVVGYLELSCVFLYSMPLGLFLSFCGINSRTPQLKISCFWGEINQNNRSRMNSYKYNKNFSDLYKKILSVYKFSVFPTLT